MIKIILPSTNKRGASSVLIILMMVVLIVFGLAALTTSLAASRLGDKESYWTSEYYILEGNAQELLFEIDGLLNQAETDAIEYIEKGNYAISKESLFPVNIQEIIYNNYTYVIPKVSTGEYLNRVFKAAFYKSAVDALIEAYPHSQLNYHGGYIRQILEDEGFTEITISMTISEVNSEVPKNLDFQIKLRAPGYNISMNDGVISWVRSKFDVGRYEILSWKEWQEYFDYSDQIKFSDIIDDAP